MGARAGDGGATSRAACRLPGPARVRHWRIDGEHSNAYAEWLRQGGPEDPSPAQLAQLRARQGLELLSPIARHGVEGDAPLVLRFDLPLFGVSLVEISPAGPGRE